MKIICDFLILNWEPIIAVLGFILSVINICYLIKTNTKSIEIKEIFYTKLNLKDRFFYEFNMIFMNKSRQPISIVDISFINKEKICSAKLDKTKISSYTDSKTKAVTTFYSSEFPINFNGLESTREMILFTLTDNIENEEMEFKITTNRGIIKKKVNFKDKYITPEEYLDKIMKNG